MAFGGAGGVIPNAESRNDVERVARLIVGGLESENESENGAPSVTLRDVVRGGVPGGDVLCTLGELDGLSIESKNDGAAPNAAATSRRFARLSASFCSIRSR